MPYNARDLKQFWNDSLFIPKTAVGHLDGLGGGVRNDTSNLNEGSSSSRSSRQSLQLRNDCALFSIDQRFGVRAIALVEPGHAGLVLIHHCLPIWSG